MRIAQMVHSLCARPSHSIVAAGAAVLLHTPAVRAQLPDLVPTRLGALGSLRAGDSTSVTVEVSNRSATSAASGWSIGVALSTDSLRGGDLFIGGTPGATISAGAARQFTVKVTIPSSANGPYFLLAVADGAGTLAESNESNNTLASAGSVVILGPAPDLIVTRVSAQAAATAGASVPFAVTVRNIGNATAAAGWRTRLHLSLDTLLTGVDAVVGDLPVAGDLRATDSLVLAGTLTVPSTVPGATYHVLALADAGGERFETSEANNLGRAAATTRVSAPVDLTATAVCCATSAFVGAQATLSSTVLNQGTVGVSGGWTVRWYLSTDNTYSTNDLGVGSVTVSSALAAQASTNVSGTFALPSAVGTYFLLVRVDDAQLVGEQSESNNVMASTGTMSLGDGPDLVPVSLTLHPSESRNGEGSARSGTIRRDSVRAVLTVSNRGSQPAAAGWGIVFTRLGGSMPSVELRETSGPSVGVGASGAVTVWLDPGLSFPWLGGSNFLIQAKVNAFGQLADLTTFARTNDIIQQPLVLVSNTDIAPIAATTSNLLGPGAQATLSLTVANKGSTVLTPPSFGRFIDVVLVSSAGGPEKSLGSLLWPSTGLAKLSQETTNLTVSIPSLSDGQYTIHLIADPQDIIPEYYDGPAGESNNTLVTPLTFTVVNSQLAVPDLEVTNIALGRTNMPPDSVVVSYSFANRGTGTAVGSSAQPIFFTVCPSYDRLTPITPSCVSGGRITQAIAPGATLLLSETLPLTCDSRTMYLLVTIDPAAQVIESNEQNNVSSSKVFPQRSTCP